MSFRVLQATGPDADIWREIIGCLPPERRDLHYSPDYGRIYADVYGQRPLLAVQTGDDNAVLHAFVRRPLGELGFLAGSDSASAYEDIATAYGFGGPLLAYPERAGSVELLREFDRNFRVWCIDERLPAEFVCLHPVLGNAAPIEASGIVQPLLAKDVVIVDLQRPVEDLWAAVSRGTRSSIQRARREGIEVSRVEPDQAAVAAFQRLYLATMARVGAAQRWLFPDAYFRACVDRLGPQRSALFFARCRGELAAAYLLILDGRTAYYHFGAADERWLALRPNNLLMYETLMWAKRAGCARYHLGGGVTADGNDSLLRFKSSFGGARAPLYTFGRVHCKQTYAELCNLKRAHEAAHGIEPAVPDYFPLYRR